MREKQRGQPLCLFMAVSMMLCLRFHKSKSVWAAVCVLVLCWLYIFPVYRIPSDKGIVEEVLRQGQTWTKNQTGIDLFSVARICPTIATLINVNDPRICLGRNVFADVSAKLLAECCDPKNTFAVTKNNSQIGKVLWYDGEFYHYHTVNSDTYPLFVQDTPFQLPLKKCVVVGNGGVLKNSGCGKEIDQADFVMRCNLPPLSKEYTADVGRKTQLVTANPSIIEKSFQSLLWSRKAFVESMKAYGSSYIYMPAFSMKPGTDLSLRAYHALADTASNQTVLFANPDFLKNVGHFWKHRGVHGRRLSTGLFLVSLALGLCDEVTAFGFWPFALDLNQQPVSHHYYDNVLPSSRFHAMPEEFLQLWHLHKTGTLRLRLGQCSH